MRHLIVNRGITIAALLSLAIGIGATATAFSWVDQMLLRPLPGVREAGRLFVLISRSSAGTPGSLSYPDYLDLRTEVEKIASVAATSFSSLTFSAGATGPAERIFAELVSDNYFTTLDPRVAVGRVFERDEARVPGANPVTVLSHAFWRRRFDGDAGVLGRTILLNNRPFTVIGVMSPAFQGGFVATDTDMWVPLVMHGHLVAEDRTNARGRRWLQGLVRRGTGVSSGELRARVDAASQRLSKEHAAIQQGRTFFVTPIWRSPAGAQSVLRPVLLGLTGLAALLLLLACANVANLLLARALQRRRELAIRLTLGADLRRAVVQFLAEGVLLAIVGGVGGILITMWAVDLLRVFQPPAAFTVRFDVQMDRVGLQFAAVIILVVAALIGLIPAIQSLRAAPGDILRTESTSLTSAPARRRLSDLLAALQVGFCVAALVGSGLSLRSLGRTRAVDVGFSSDNLLLVSYDLPPDRYSEDAGLEFQRRLLEWVAAIPNVTSATTGTTVPFGLEGQSIVSIQVDGYSVRPGEDMQVRSNIVGPWYFRTMGIALVRGREFNDRDTRSSQPVAVVSQAFARRYWPDGDAVGRRIRVRDQPLEVVGVAADVRYDTLREEPPLLVYVSAFQSYRPATTLHVRTSAPAGVLGEIRRAVMELDPALPLFNTTTLATQVEASTFVQRFAASLSLALIVPCLVLTAVGIFSLLTYAVAERTAEIGLRVALGAQRRDIARMVLRHAAIVSGAGMCVGLVGGIFTASLLNTTLVGIEPADPVTWMTVIFTVVAVVALASSIAASRATRIGPLVALGRIVQQG